MIDNKIRIRKQEHISGFLKGRERSNNGFENIILVGVESHVCIFQTCVSMLARGYQVHVPQDAVDSRTDENRQVGLSLMKGAGAFVTSTEAVIYQILKKAGTKAFKKMLSLIR